MLVSMAGAATVLLVFRVEEEEEGGGRQCGWIRLCGTSLFLCLQFRIWMGVGLTLHVQCI